MRTSDHGSPMPTDASHAGRPGSRAAACESWLRRRRALLPLLPQRPGEHRAGRRLVVIAVVAALLCAVQR